MAGSGHLLYFGNFHTQYLYFIIIILKDIKLIKRCVQLSAASDSSACGAALRSCVNFGLYHRRFCMAAKRFTVNMAIHPVLVEWNEGI